MFTQSLRRAVASTSAALLLAATFLAAQEHEPKLALERHQGDRPYNRATPTAGLETVEAFRRIGQLQFEESSLKRHRSRTVTTDRAIALTRVRQPASAISSQSFGTGGGDIFEIEPNGLVAQGVSLPVNVFGEISFNGDVDYFAFRALPGQQITVEAFAARLANSVLVPDLALFNSAGQLLRNDAGDADTDPIVRYIPEREEVLIAGIADVDDLGGGNADYLLNISRGIDVQELEPNDQSAQQLPDLPITVFGEIAAASDVDFYSFVASAGQTLIVDVDAEVLGSRLDPEINLINPDGGVEYFYNDQYDGDDSRFNIVLPYTGRYVIGLGAFERKSRGFYRLNSSLLPSTGAPTLTEVRRLSKKLSEVFGVGFDENSVVEVNSTRIRTSIRGGGTLRAKGKVRVGDVITVSNPPDDRRSNPLIVH